MASPPAVGINLQGSAAQFSGARYVRRMIDENTRVAWNAAYWLIQSEARRQSRSAFPDCDWKMIENHDEFVSAVIEAQARECHAAMQGPSAAKRQHT